MRNFCALILASIILPAAAHAAAWPGNWLGQPDNEYRALEILVYYHAAVLHDLPDENGVSPLPAGRDWLAELAALPEQQVKARNAELERVLDQVSAAARFYWRNSRFNCALECYFTPDYEPRLRSTIASADAPYYSPVDHPYYGTARQEVDGLLQIMVLYQYDKETDSLKRVKGGGGFTWGCDAVTGDCGWSWWAACTADNVCGSDWLVVHEFGHQLDSLFEQSGHPELWFNHLAPGEGNVAAFGEHFDANAYILRRIPEYDWHDLKWGELRTFADADGDHVPDPDDYLWVQQLEVDPDPTTTDTDVDGLSDFEEFLASNGNPIGHGERLHPALSLCDPTVADTDGDGLADGADPLPSLALPRFVPEQKQDLPPALAMVRLPTTGPAPAISLALGYKLDYHWEEEEQDGALIIEIATGSAGDETPAEVKLMLDLDYNGWFDGADNYQFMLDATGITKAWRHDGSSAVEWPRVDPAAVDLAAIPHEVLPSPQGGWACRLTLPRSQFPQLAAKPGEQIGLGIGVRRAGTVWYYTLNEPNAFLPLELR